MDNKLYKAKKLAKKELAGDTEKIKTLRIKQSNGHELTFKERNILKIYDKKLAKAIKRSLK